MHNRSVKGIRSHRPSRLPPGSKLGKDDHPQFVCIGWDDNYFPEGMDWILDFLENRYNKDGSPARCTFFVNTDNSFPLFDQDNPLAQRLRTTWKRAVDHGHELGNHTKTHREGLRESEAEIWREEIQGCDDDLLRLGLDHSQVQGFRSPFLFWSKTAMEQLKLMGFRYDCSMEQPWSAQESQGRSFWPYTLNYGPCDGAAAEYATGSWKHLDGLWEIPLNPVVVPPDLQDQVEKKLQLADPGFTLVQSRGMLTGLDYNLWMDPDEHTPSGLSGDEVYQTLCHSLDLHMANGRSPMSWGAHTPFYDPLTLPGPDNDWPEYHQNATIEQMRSAVEGFIDYALSHENVRLVTHRGLIDWMEAMIDSRS